LRVEVAAGRTGAGEATREVTSMLPDWPDPPERVLLLDTLARLDPSNRSRARAAAALYRELYAQTGSRQYGRAYQRLTGGLEGLPPTRPLPRLAGEVAAEPVDLDALFTRVEELAASTPTAVKDTDPAAAGSAPTDATDPPAAGAHS
jgi:hypothetical protein